MYINIFKRVVHFQAANTYILLSSNVVCVRLHKYNVLQPFPKVIDLILK